MGKTGGKAYTEAVHKYAGKTHGQLAAELSVAVTLLSSMRAKLRGQQTAAASLARMRKTLAARDSEIAELKSELADRREQVRVLAYRLKKHEE